ncbi:transketolase [Venenivibrio stagnispumantis]|uniref:Transketolase n=1 Tax=Venenivibrio stagnispumantis TaxID=407998 RepID=A0AA45WL52_9AQUI|nr:transketolase [Venenivibrio stagnispumantis]MCW4573668.1 transketolase [Venenivibrio stagnispumantis]SMP09819.1 transketolase [Venenivibrio stagnispumantis]
MADIEKLKEIAKELRRDIITMVYNAQSGHPGGSLSAIDIMTVLYFGGVLRYNPKDPWWEDRDRFVLSKGHASPALYSVLAKAGYFPREELLTYRKTEGYAEDGLSRLQGHPAWQGNKHGLPGVEASTGSLGQGLSFGIGMALSGRLSNKDYRVYVMLGDGEIQEGMVWEAFMFAGHHKLDNLCAIIDNNNLQIDGDVRQIINIHPIKEKLQAFHWHTVEIDGHDYNQIISAFEEAKNTKGKPTCIIAHTIKGKGVSFMENNFKWHGVAPNKEQYEKAMAELS